MGESVLFKSAAQVQSSAAKYRQSSESPADKKEGSENQKGQRHQRTQPTESTD